ncbi:MAG: tRNA threonylcarbamoyladenosine biosynthesis protein TsaB [Vampirovibrio sp.]|jgi:tRNA threonylcarbamoyl adenosine modification protein YeaZ|nr:tRNA threonylcarbamoyladenosine biosynthesis protein TsaB [Vampirovibrio sp.]
MSPAEGTILYLDTATSRLMLAVSHQGQFVAQRNVACESHRYHSALIIPAIQDMLQEADLSVSNLAALAVNHGPGSFTGIRTGIITVRTMAQFLNLPVHGFNPFELLAYGYTQPVSVYIDALRGRAYHARVSFDEAGPVYEVPPALITLKPEGQAIEPDTVALVSPTLNAFFPETGVDWIPDDFFSPAPMLALIKRYHDRFVTGWQAVRPLYLQEPSITLRKAPSAS